MDDVKKLVEVLKMGVGGNNNIPFIIGTVESIDGDKCSVNYGSENNITTLGDVRLKATIGSDTGNYLLVVPKVGSMVTLGSTSGDYNDLCVVKVDEIDHIEILQNGLKILVDGNDGRVSIKNSGADLLDIFNQLVQILQQLKVFTPSGVSGTPVPDSMVQIEYFKTSFQALLK